MYGRKEAGFRKEDIGAEVLRKKEEGGGREGPRTAEEEDRVCGGGSGWAGDKWGCEGFICTALQSGRPFA